jgi:hypothetical protein
MPIAREESGGSFQPQSNLTVEDLILHRHRLPLSLSRNCLSTLEEELEPGAGAG